MDEFKSANCEVKNLREDLLHHRNEVDIDTIHLPGVNKLISFYSVFVCVRLSLAPSPLIVFTLFASSGSSVFSSGAGGRNNLITFSLPPPAS